MFFERSPTPVIVWDFLFIFGSTSIYKMLGGSRTVELLPFVPGLY